MLFRSYAFIGIVLFICSILVVKAFIWIRKKIFGFLRMHLGLKLLKNRPGSMGPSNLVVRKSDEKATSSWPEVNNESRCGRGRYSNGQSKKQNIQVFKSSKYMEVRLM